MEQKCNEINITVLKGVGVALQKKLQRIDIYSVRDLLLHLPLRYEDRTQITCIKDLRIGERSLIQAAVLSTQIIPGRKKNLVCQVQDATGVLSVRFFHFYVSQLKHFKEGNMVRLFGEIRIGRRGLEMNHPEYKVLYDETEPLDASLTPVYGTTEGVTQNRLRLLCREAMGYVQHPTLFVDLFPKRVQEKFHLYPIRDAIEYVHFPPIGACVRQLEQYQHASQRSLILEELLAHHMLMKKCYKVLRKKAAVPLIRHRTFTKAFIQSLPFHLTESQHKVVDEIACDMEKSVPMLRLLQGDVGSGKTVVAAVALLQAVENKKQAALMVPTEILAEQHDKNLKRWFEPLGVRIVLLTGKTKGKMRQQSLEALVLGQIHCVVGTHSLFQEDVVFQSLGLVIIDEQHRFGVDQRMALYNKGAAPHQLLMTATPIPRTLAMSIYAGFDHSVITGLPPGRIPIKTVVMEDTRREEVIARVRTFCQKGGQVYWVCTLIEESELFPCHAAEVVLELLQKSLPDLKLELIHGKVLASEKNRIMEQFKACNIDVLVATTVIEVGVDVPNASLMVIENSERLGLSQLHQLRGRVGRGNTESYCVLLFHAPLSLHGKERLHAMRCYSDGFAIAEKDLELRGPGEVLGTKQTGEIAFRIAHLQRDGVLMEMVHRMAEYIEQNDLNVESDLIKRWLAHREHYLNY